MTSLDVALYTALVAILVYLLLNLRTRLFNRHPNHPLRLPPGPKPWPLLGNLPHLGTKPHQSLAALAGTYGPLMHLRLGFVDAIVASSPSVAAQLFKIHDANFSDRPHRPRDKYITYNYQDLVFAPYGPRWQMLRKLCQIHLFSNKTLNDFSHVRQEEAAVLTHALTTAGNGPKNLSKLLNVCIANTLARLMVGKRVFGDRSGVGDAKADEFKDLVLELMVLGGVFNISDYIPSLEWLDLQGVAAKSKKLHARLDKFFHEILEEHKSKINSDSADGDGKCINFLTTLILFKDNADGKGGKLTDTEIKALITDMFLAGTDTSLSTIEWAIAELIRHPEILAQVQQEIDSVVGQDRLVTELDLPQLPYLQAVVKETFRLHPSTPLSLPRVAAESCNINGYNIPKNSTLILNIWAISHDPKIWIQPLKFKPNRFLPGGEKLDVDVKGTDFELIPFGAGRRICSGMMLGLRMVQLLTATLVHAFDWKLPTGQLPEELNMEEAYGLTLHRTKPLMVQPWPRLSSDAYQT